MCYVNHKKVFPPQLWIDTTVLRKVRCPAVRAEVAQYKACGWQSPQWLWHKRIPGGLGGSLGSFSYASAPQTTQPIRPSVALCILRFRGLVLYRYSNPKGVGVGEVGIWETSLVGNLVFCFLGGGWGVNWGVQTYTKIIFWSFFFSIFFFVLKYQIL